ncbi:MAG: tetratricopeptide repeat protein [Candidatus Hydrogenedentes bacterium]|nr:tetratricopeptide repeat protein [Candidatus Hydrogenedentota bacterium]
MSKALTTIRRLLLEMRLYGWTGARRYDRALQAATECTRLFPDEASYWTNRALCEVQLAKYDDALKSAETCLRKDPCSPGGHLWKAKALQGQGNLLPAILAYRDAMVHAGDDNHLHRFIERQVEECSRQIVMRDI